jgi:hypothetical protein
MIKLLIGSLLFIFCSSVTFGQAAYRGGTGDSFASIAAYNLSVPGLYYEASQEVVFFPNPVKAGSAFKAVGPYGTEDTVDVLITDLKGLVILKTSIIARELQTKGIASPETSGIYLVRIQSGNYFGTLKLVVIP